jgi:hypothetical protein
LSGKQSPRQRHGHDLHVPHPHAVTIPHRFNGPLDSGQGGYSAGLVATFIDGPADVSLRRPVPLDTPLEVATDGDGDGTVRVLAGEELIADGRPAHGLEVDVPEPVGLDAAREATSRYAGEREGPFSRCFVCGLTREDGFHVFAGRVAERRVLASPWTPPAWAAGDDGVVRPEFIWAALDCPATFATLLDDDASIGVLARLRARIDAPVVAGREHVVIGWPMGAEGRKAHAGSAILSAGGSVLAAATALLVTPRS